MRKYLLDNEIRTEIHYPVPPTKQVAMQGIIDQEKTPIAELIHETTLSLPISYAHTEQDILQTIDFINKYSEISSQSA